MKQGYIASILALKYDLYQNYHPVSKQTNKYFVKLESLQIRSTRMTQDLKNVPGSEDCEKLDLFSSDSGS